MSWCEQGGHIEGYNDIISSTLLIDQAVDFSLLPSTTLPYLSLTILRQQ